MKNIISFIVFFALLHTVQAKTMVFNVPKWTHIDETTNGNWANWETTNARMFVNYTTDYTTSAITFDINPETKYEIIEKVNHKSYTSMLAKRGDIIVEIEIRKLTKTTAELAIYYKHTKDLTLGLKCLIQDFLSKKDMQELFLLK